MSKFSAKQGSGVDEMTEKWRSLTLDPEGMEVYQRCVKEAKGEARNGNLRKSLELFNLAYKIHPSEKLKGRIKKIEEAIEELERQGSESEDDEFVNVNNCGLMVFKDLHDKLYDHQKEGVAFLYGLHKANKIGGILADDMGLGKTIQIIAFLSGMYDAECIQHTLLVMPTTLISNWTREFAKWTPGMRVKEFYGTSKTERNRNLEKVQRRSGVIITTYQMLINNWQLLSSFNDQEFTWDYVILDEAHKIKTSSTKTAKSAHAIPAKHRILLTGTPVQNNLREMWALFDFACQGSLLGTSKTFKSEYENPIIRAREKDATPGEKALGLKISENLMAIINPYFLRRTKHDIQTKKQGLKVDDGNDLNSEDKETRNPSGGAEMPSLTRKNDLIVWTYLSPVQEDIYKQFISLDHIKELLMTTRSPLAELNVLKKLCDHPRLLSSRAMAQLGLEEETGSHTEENEQYSAAVKFDHVSDESLISESGKLTFLVVLLERLHEEGNRTLVFSQSRKMLDIIERVLMNRGFKIIRIDGTVTHLAEREKRIARFQTSKEFSVFLLTTQVGGVGITLTSANRVVIFDPSWNPATDAQAVDRAYRIGQKENVVIYRLITCGTVEEKIYRRQVFKDSLIRQTTGDKKNPFRYFSQQELKELFKLEDTRSSSTQLQLQSLHSNQRRTDPELDNHIEYLHSMEMFGISDHDLMFSHDAPGSDEDPGDQESQHYIANRVQKAHELMKAESELHNQLAENMQTSTEPAWLHNPDPPKRITEKKPVKKDSCFPTVGAGDYDSASPTTVDLTETGSEPEDDIHNISTKIINLALDISVEETGEVAIEHVQNENDYEEDSQNGCPFDVSLEAKPDAVDSSESGEPPVVMPSWQAKDKCLVVDSDDHVNVQDVTSPVPQDKYLKKVRPQNIEATPEFYSLPFNPETSSKKERSLLVHSLINPRLSSLQKSTTEHDSYYEDANSKLSAESPSLQCDFNLQLEDSAEENVAEEENGTSEEDPSLHLQMETSSSTEKEPSPVKSVGERAGVSNTDESPENNLTDSDDEGEVSFISTRKKKKALVICDSEDEQEDSHGEQQNSMSGSPYTSFKGIGSSTPKGIRSVSSFVSVTPNRKSFGGNTSVASRRSFVESVLDDVEDMDEDVETEEDEQSVSSEDKAEEAEPTDESVEEEPKGEILNSEVEEGEASEYLGTDSSAMEESALDQSTGDTELTSNEKMDLCTKNELILSNEDTATMGLNCESSVPDVYDNLVKTGKEYFAQGNPKEALKCFLQALDIKNGDPEIQLMTIQLYRQISQ
ncbi:DNA excision repair protein ERCC-6-like [Amia ocellicauda]|uniref:DNA excision repair protein ERCC-6-like n=1 Tax=Amia ocellicauda TaxID=2972642 RepID=UPI00346391EF